jgi:hypothetical protein
MEKKKSYLSPWLKTLTQSMGVGLGIGMLLVLALVGFVIYMLKGCGASADQESRIGITPVEIAKIRDIGQWEFLSVSDEELVDTVRHGFFGDDELSRIYYGTLRLGIDLNEAGTNFITMDQDTVNVMLPPIKLLDHHFIDEANTRSFYEEGRWTEKDKAALTHRAERAMKTRCITPSNVRSAEQNATSQISQVLKAMGYEYSKIRFESEGKKGNDKN